MRPLRAVERATFLSLWFVTFIFLFLCLLSRLPYYRVDLQHFVYRVNVKTYGDVFIVLPYYRIDLRYQTMFKEKSDVYRITV